MVFSPPDLEEMGVGLIWMIFIKNSFTFTLLAYIDGISQLLLDSADDILVDNVFVFCSSSILCFYINRIKISLVNIIKILLFLLFLYCHFAYWKKLIEVTRRK